MEALDQTEDHLVVVAVTDEGVILEEDQTRRMFALPASVEPIKTR